MANKTEKKFVVCTLEDERTFSDAEAALHEAKSRATGRWGGRSKFVVAEVTHIVEPLKPEVEVTEIS
jgi:hypothetical protein